MPISERSFEALFLVHFTTSMDACLAFCCDNSEETVVGFIIFATESAA